MCLTDPLLPRINIGRILLYLEHYIECVGYFNEDLIKLALEASDVTVVLIWKSKKEII